MSKIMRKSIAVLLMAVMVFGIIIIAPFQVSALTQSDVVSWMESKKGTTITDGGTQCVAAFNSYLRLWGITSPISNYPVNYAYQIFNYDAPSGWQKIAGSGNYQVGDVVIWNSSVGSGAGHVGMVYSTSGTVKIFDQNYVAKSLCGIHDIAQTGAIRGVFRPPLGNNPTGVVDSVTGGVGTVTARGWTFDKDDLTQSLSIHVYIGGSSAVAGAESTALPANVSRQDVDNVYHVGEFHGFDAVIPTSKTGTQDVYIYAINIGGGGNVELGHQTVYISPDTEKPTAEKSYISRVSTDSYRVCVVPKDNVGIKSVRVATWTSSQSDLIWHDASFNGYETYFVDINRSDYSSTQNSFYNNHIYIYDYAGNYISIAQNQDYKITSDTGMSVPEGEYRIATAVNNNRYLDVAAGSTASGANIQIYDNYISPKQTFSLKYLNNGFYTISNTNSGHLLDVQGDTYLSGTNVQQCVDNGGANQQWMIKPTDENDGYYYIIARSNGLALDVAYAKDADGTNVQVHTQNQSTAQKWKLRRVLKEDMVNAKDLITSDENTAPAITVTVDDKILSENTDYTLTYENDLSSGTGTATVTGISNYCDSVKITYAILNSEPTDVPTEPTEKATESPTPAPTQAPTSAPETQPSEPISKPIIKGDATLSGDVDILDATMIQIALAAKTEYSRYFDTTSPYFLACDVDQSGEVDVLDATLIQMYLAHSENPVVVRLSIGSSLG